jgi:hypothetical protein
LDDDNPHAVAIVAHEFGHVVTIYDHLQERGECPSDEWQSELTADWHAYRWGFGQQIEANRAIRDWMHHCVGPGEWFEVYGFRYQVGLDFTVTCLGPAEARESGAGKGKGKSRKGKEA